MKIYFAGSIRGGRSDVLQYLEIINHLKIYGEVLTEFVGDSELDIDDKEGLGDRFIHDRDIKWLLSSDLVVAEVTVPSLGVGYEIGRGLENKIPILCLFRDSSENKLSAMINGSQKLSVKKYNELEQAKKIIDTFIKDLRS
ncbi:MAG: nucleoside 2-deoxyribosyltransferase [Candidatus Hodarchaeales archaeon]|jgi:hypothetical protein